AKNESHRRHLSILDAQRLASEATMRARLYDQAAGCLRIPANACSRVESAGVFAVVALPCRESARLLSFARSFLFRWDFPALRIAFCRVAIRSAERACDRSS